MYRDGVVVPGTTRCELQPCTAGACCDMAENRWTVQTTELGEWAVGSEPCTNAVTSELRLWRITAFPVATNRFKNLMASGTLSLPGPGSLGEQLDVVDQGMVSVSSTARRERTISGWAAGGVRGRMPGGAYDPITRTGWKVVKDKRWVWVGPKVGGPGGIRKLVLRDRSNQLPGGLKFSVKASDSSYFTTGPTGHTPIEMIPALVLPDSGRCIEGRYPETYPARPSCWYRSGADFRCG